MPPIPISILICTRNRAGQLRETLRTVAALDVPARYDPELIVVDNASSDATAEVIGRSGVSNMLVRQVVERRVGASWARNAAIRAARGQILLWTDDDMKLPGNWIEAMCQPVASGKAAAVQGGVRLAPEIARPWMESFHRTALASTEAIDREVPTSLISANMALSRSVIQDVPGFDPELGPGRLGTLEDTLFSWQLRQAGHNIIMVPQVEAIHHVEAGRLMRTAFIRAAIARGRSLAYIRYHWLHWTAADWTHRARRWHVWRDPYVVLSKRYLDWMAQRLMQSVTASRGPISKREFYLIMNIYSLRQYLVERKRPRNYAKCGLSKIHGVQIEGAHSERERRRIRETGEESPRQSVSPQR